MKISHCVRWSQVSVIVGLLFCIGVGLDTQAQEAPGLKPVVAVFDVSVDGMTLPVKTVKLLTGYLSSRLTAGGVYKVGPGSAIKEAMIDLKIESQKECYDQACRIELGKSAAANMNLNSQIWKVGKLCSVNLDLYDLKTEAMENSVEVSGLDCSESGLKAGIARAAVQISGGKAVATQQETVGGVENALPTAPELGSSGSASTGADNLPTIKAEIGYLSVEGSPKGARVDISGPKGFGDKGKAATVLPVRPFQVPAGSYTVKVSWTDFDSEEKAVRVYADATEIVKVELVKSTGQLELSGKPEGAKSRLECQKGFAKDFGLPGTPVTLTVPRGECRVMVERDGYEKYDNRVAVEGGQVSRVKVDLKREMVDASGGSAVSAGSGPGGVQWVRIPGGSFQMGSNDGSENEKPVHAVNVQTFEIAKTEVTVAQYRKCVEAGACSKPDDKSSNSNCNWGYLDRDNHPINCVDWDQSSVYAKWVGGRLPTEAEWEYAARSGGKDRKYPWGDQTATCQSTVMSEGGNGCGKGSTWPVCSKVAGNTEQGLCDMAGNVSEWVQDWYHNSYNGAPSDGSAWESPTGSYRVRRGGSWNVGANNVRAAYRSSWEPEYRSDFLVLRPARSAR